MEKLIPVFDVENFIREIRKRPAIWDVTSVEYSNQVKKAEAWVEVCRIWKENFNDLSTERKRVIGNQLRKEWKNIRLAYVRGKKRTRDTPSRSAGGRRPKYVNANLLSFLDSVLQDKPTSRTSTNIPPIEEDESANEDEEKTARIKVINVSSIPTQPPEKKRAKKKRISSDKDKLFEAISKSIQQRESIFQADEEKLFLLSLANDMKSIPPEKRLQAKAEIINVIAKYKTNISTPQRAFIPNIQNSPQQFTYSQQYQQKQALMPDSLQLHQGFQALIRPSNRTPNVIDPLDGTPTSPHTPDNASFTSDPCTSSESSIELFPQ